MRGSSPIGASLRRIITHSVVIVRVGGRSSNHEKSGFGRAVPQRALRGLLDAPLEAGHDNPRGRRGKLKLARKKGSVPPGGLAPRRQSGALHVGAGFKPAPTQPWVAAGDRFCPPYAGAYDRRGHASPL